MLFKNDYRYIHVFKYYFLKVESILHEHCVTLDIPYKIRYNHATFLTYIKIIEPNLIITFILSL